MAHKADGSETSLADLAAHLRLRLTFARLKVVHGWHKQTLAEVENLYFRRFQHQQDDRLSKRRKLSSDFKKRQENTIRNDDLDDSSSKIAVDGSIPSAYDRERTSTLSGDFWKKQIAGSFDVRATNNPQASSSGKPLEALGLNDSGDQRTGTAAESPIPSYSQAGTFQHERVASSSADKRAASIYDSPTSSSSTPLSGSVNKSPAATASSLPVTSFPFTGGANVGLASSYDDFWAKLSTPGTSVSPSAVTPAFAQLRSPPNILSRGNRTKHVRLLSRSSSSTASISTSAVLSATGTNSTSKKQNDLFSTLSSGRTTSTLSANSSASDVGITQPHETIQVPGRTLGDHASFSSLPPIPPLPFGGEESDHPGKDEHVVEGPLTSARNGSDRRSAASPIEDFPMASQEEEEISMEILDDAFA